MMFLIALLGGRRVIIEVVMLALPVRLGIIAIVTDNAFLHELDNSLFAPAVGTITSTATLRGRNRLIRQEPNFFGSRRSERVTEPVVLSSRTGGNLE
jgi:hypothetical protein